MFSIAWIFHYNVSSEFFICFHCFLQQFLPPKLILWSHESLFLQSLGAPCSAEGLGVLRGAVEPKSNLG